MSGESGNSSCKHKLFTCGGKGSILVVVCSPPLNPLQHKLATRGRKKISWLVPGSLSMAYEDDWSKAYYALIFQEGGGFYLEGDMDSFDEPQCNDVIVSWLVRTLSNIGVQQNMLAIIQYILSTKVFKSV
jgi:hypothetical protein